MPFGSALLGGVSTSLDTNGTERRKPIVGREGSTPKRRWPRWTAILLLLVLGLLAKGYWNATRDPIVHRATVEIDNWPAGEPPLKVLLLSDTHVAGPDMPPERLKRIVADLNRLKPDLVLIAGDLVSEKRLATHIYTPDEVTAPLHDFKARLGTIAALGNHDHWFDPKAIEAGLRKGGVAVLKNEAIARGPLIIGGVDDDFSNHDDVPATFAAMDSLPAKPRILVTHSPDVVPDLPSPVTAVFAGHTHCGQIVLPVYGPLSYVSRYGDRFGCGDIDDKGQRVFVGAGLGTSILPLRYGAHPDVWLVTLSGRDKQISQQNSSAEPVEPKAANGQPRLSSAAQTLKRPSTSSGLRFCSRASCDIKVGAQ